MVFTQRRKACLSSSVRAVPSHRATMLNMSPSKRKKHTALGNAVTVMSSDSLR